jgi:acetylglutamate kinase
MTNYPYPCISETNRQRDAIVEQFPGLVGSLGNAPIVVKFGGAAMEDPATRSTVCTEVAALCSLGVRMVVVHGGGKEISRWIERLGGSVTFVDGLRVTSTHDMEVIEMVLSGRVNSDLVSRLSHAGVAAVGISGRSGRLLEATPLRGKNGEDLGQAGTVTQVRLDTVRALLSAGLLPVISPVGESAEGVPLNLNADYAAAAVAGALAAASCIFLTDVDGVRRAGSLQPTLTPTQIAELIQDGTVYGGMIPKVECALGALQSGCGCATITAAHKPLAISNALAQTPDRSTTVLNPRL